MISNKTCKGTKLVTRNQDIKSGQSGFAIGRQNSFYKSAQNVRLQPLAVNQNPRRYNLVSYGFSGQKTASQWKFESIIYLTSCWSSVVKPFSTTFIATKSHSCSVHDGAGWVVNPGGGTLRISGCGCAARTLEPLAYTRASFSWILLPYTRVNSWFPWSSQPTGQFREKW